MLERNDINAAITVDVSNSAYFILYTEPVVPNGSMLAVTKFFSIRQGNIHISVCIMNKRNDVRLFITIEVSYTAFFIT